MDELLYFDFNNKSSVLLIFFSNAVIFSFLVLKSGISERKRQNKWLSAFIILGGLYICPFMFGYANWYAQNGYREFLFFVPFQQLLLLGPVFYFYTRILLNNKSEFSKKDFIHFIPALLYLLYSLIVFITDVVILDEFYFYADNQDKDLDLWYQVSGLISMLFYLFLSLKYYIHYRKLSVQEVSFADEIAFKWIQNFIIAFSLILVLRILFFFINPEWGQFGKKYWYYLSFSILLLYVSIAGYTNTIKASIGLDKNILDDLEPERKNNDDIKNTSEASSELSKWKNKIVQLFESEELYKKSDLTLTDLANLLNTNRNIISKAINPEFNINFNDFVNEKRAEAVIEKLNKGEHKQNTLLGIAIDCGFNSKTTFNRAFKKHTSLTPKQYINKKQL